jgi:drug/metabolite transporter (DMT)-like permease
LSPNAALLLVSALWGTTFVLVKSGLQDSTPLLFVGLRFTVAAIVTLILFPTRAFAPGAWVRGVPLGLALAAAYASQTIGLATTTPARSAFLTALNVAIVPIWAVILLRHRPRPVALLGLAGSIAGIALLTSPEGGSCSAGDLWTIACAVLFALHVVLLSRWGGSWGTESLLLAQLAVTAGVALALAPLEGARLVPTPRLALAVGGTALFATAGTTWLQLRYQPRVDPTLTAILYATEPIFAALFSWAVLGETMSATAMAGSACIVGGAVLAAMALGPAARR